MIRCIPCSSSSRETLLKLSIIFHHTVKNTVLQSPAVLNLDWNGLTWNLYFVTCHCMRHSSFPYPVPITKQSDGSPFILLMLLIGHILRNLIARLLFTLPVSNRKLERVFSMMKAIKQEKWSMNFSRSCNCYS